MESRPIRWLVCAIAVLVFAASGYFVSHSEQQIASRAETLRLFDVSAREAGASLADLRAGQQAYVAAGQGVAFWMPKVSALAGVASESIDTLRGVSANAEARALLMQAAASITEFQNVDKRARDYLKSNQPLMAADVVFTEGSQSAGDAAKQVNAASVAEHHEFDEFESSQKKAELYALGGGGAFAALMLVVLAAFGAPSGRADESSSETLAANDLHITHERTSSPAPADAAVPREQMPALKTAALLCTDFGRVRDAHDLEKLLERAADALEASGLLVWLRTPGGDLRAVLGHGYHPQMVARMPTIPRTAENAAAAAYRSGAMQIVLARPGDTVGALVAPLISPDGCIGALTAEIRGGAESSDAVQSLAAIFAAQLAGVLASSAQPDVAAEPPRAAAGH